MRIGLREAQSGLFGFDVVEIEQQFQILLKVGCAESPLERGPQMCLQLIRLALPLKAFFIDRVEIVVEHSERLAVFGGAGTNDDVESLIDTPRVQQAPGHVGGNRAICQLFFGIAGHVGVDIPLGVRDIRQDDRPRRLLVASRAVLRQTT